MRFRQELVRRDLGETLFEEIAAQLKARHSTLTGTLIDATIIDRASKDDGEARWVKHKGKPARHGYKAHVTCNQETVLIETVSTTTANVNDGKAGAVIKPACKSLLPPSPII